MSMAHELPGPTLRKFGNRFLMAAKAQEHASTGKAARLARLQAAKESTYDPKIEEATKLAVGEMRRLGYADIQAFAKDGITSFELNERINKMPDWNQDRGHRLKIALAAIGLMEA
jgi:hypothetical protein